MILFYLYILANNLPLPAFNHTALNAKLSTYDPSLYNTLLPEQPQAPAQIAPAPIQMMPGGVLPPPPTKKHVRNMSGTIQVSRAELVSDVILQR